MAYLKQSLPYDEKVLLQMTARNGQEEGQYGRKFKYSFAWNNRPFDHSATLNEEKTLQKVTPGDAVYAKKIKNQYGNDQIYWDLTDGSPARTMPSSAPQKNPDPPVPAAPSLEAVARQKQISLAGVYQARLSAGMDTEKAREAAITDVAWLERTAANLAVNDGDNQEPKFADEPGHKASVTIEEVNQVF